MSALRPTVGAKVYHLMAGPGDVAPYVLTPGDPDRVPRIAKYWDSARAVATHREYVTYTGTYKGAPISAVSTGIGGPAAAIALRNYSRLVRIPSLGLARLARSMSGLGLAMS